MSQANARLSRLCRQLEAVPGTRLHNVASEPTISLSRFVETQSGSQHTLKSAGQPTRSVVSRGEVSTPTLGKVVERPRETPIRYAVDILVVGGGPAGLAAAVSAKRAAPELVVMVAERSGMLGGTITQAGMESIHWYRYEGTAELGGFGAEIERVADEAGAVQQFPFNSSGCLQAEAFKLVADKMVLDAGVKPLLHCYAVEAIVSARDERGKATITGVIFESKSGRFAVTAKRVVDCTGDADVAFLSGSRVTVLNREDRMGMTMVFNVKGVDKPGFVSYMESNPATYADWGKSSGEFSQETEGKEQTLRSPYFKEFQKVPSRVDKSRHENIDGTWSTITDAGECQNLNLVHFKHVDGLAVEDLTRCEMSGRANAIVAMDMLREHIPGFEKCELRNYASYLGVRDTRKIVGEHDLCEADVMNDGRFPDACGSFVRFVDGYARLVLPIDGRRFQIPLRSLVPIDTANLLVGGRCIAGDPVSHGSTRNMGCCFVTGQAAGIASAVSLRERCESNASSSSRYITALQAECRKQGMVL